jgi:ribosomal protein S18 acetylase RimI-like enzyme
MTIEIKILGPGDEDILRRVAAGVFDHPVEDQLVLEFLADRRHHLVVAIADRVVVGFASALTYIHPDKRPQMWINEVGVAPTHRRQGLAKAILHELLQIGRKHQCSVAWVLTDRGNTAAMALYSSLGGLKGVDCSGPSDAMLGYSFQLIPVF